MATKAAAWGERQIFRALSSAADGAISFTSVMTASNATISNGAGSAWDRQRLSAAYVVASRWYKAVRFSFFPVARCRDTIGVIGSLCIVPCSIASKLSSPYPLDHMPFKPSHVCPWKHKSFPSFQALQRTAVYTTYEMCKRTLLRRKTIGQQGMACLIYNI